MDRRAAWKSLNEEFEHGTHRKEAVKRLQKTPTKDITAIVIIVVAMD
jgi:hypothetical protein